MQEVKLWQMMALMKEVEMFVLERDVALIMCGDFNSDPASSVYEFLAEGCINNSRSELEGAENAVYLPDIGNIVHNIDMASVMSTVQKTEPAFTNYTTNCKGTLDYIWYTPSRVKVMACTAIPEEKDLLEFGESLPNAMYPSDHLMICCDVALSPMGAPVTRGANGGGSNAIANSVSGMLGGVRKAAGANLTRVTGVKTGRGVGGVR